MSISETRLLARRKKIGVAPEAVPGVAATIGAETTAWVPCYELTFTPEVGFIERDILSTSLATETTDSVGTQFARITFKCDVTGSTVTQVASDVTADDMLPVRTGTPSWIVAMMGCGFFPYYADWEDLGGASGTFGTATCWNVLLPSNSPPQPNDSSSTLGQGKDKQVTLTLSFWEDGRQYTVSGAMGNVTFSGTAGDLLYANFEFLGVLSAIAVSAAEPSGSFNDATPTPLSRTDKTSWTLPDTVAAVGSTNLPPISTWELNCGNAYDLYKDVNVDKAASYACIYETKPSLTVTSLAYADGANAEKLLITRAIESTTGVFQTVAGITGEEGTNLAQQFLFGLPKAQANSVETGEETGYLTETATCKLIDSTTLTDTSGILTTPKTRTMFLAYGAEVESAFLSSGSIDDPTA